MSDTGEKATPFTLENRLYHERARKALPLLVRQAEAGHTLSYSDLANELGMPNARNLNFVLGSIGETLNKLSESWHRHIPPIQCLVVNKETGLPGNGVTWFLTDKESYEKLPLSQKRAVVKAELSHIFAYPSWRQVLAAFDLQPVAPQYAVLIAEAASFRGGGESENHRRLKEFVAHHPEIVGLPALSSQGEIEYLLPSGDSVDVSFINNDTWIAVEVKSNLSSAADIVRGIYQCVKYCAVMKAVMVAQSQVGNPKAILVLQSTLPPNLVPLRNTLGIEVIENVTLGA